MGKGSKTAAGSNQRRPGVWVSNVTWKEGTGRIAKGLLRVTRKRPLGVASSLVILIFVVLAVFAPLIAPNGPNSTDVPRRLESPNTDRFFGTDFLGRDMTSRIIHGTRISLLIGVVAVGVGGLIGAAWGLASGYAGGLTDLLSQRILDSMLAFPILIIALALSIALGPSIQNVIIAIAFTRIPLTARVVRSITLSVKQNMYVDAAEAMGCYWPRVLFRHIAPNCMAPFIIVLTSSLGVAIITEATLGFLGAGVPPPTPTWGAMLGSLAGQIVYMPWWLVVFPGLAIFIIVMAFNLLGDTIRDTVDPRLRGT